MKKNIKSKYFFRILFCFFLVFVALLIAYESGYYETRMGNKAVLTKEAMEKFESDVANGEVVDIKYQVSVGVFSEEQVFCFSAMIVYY